MALRMCPHASHGLASAQRMAAYTVALPPPSISCNLPPNIRSLPGCTFWPILLVCVRARAAWARWVLLLAILLLVLRLAISAVLEK